MTHSRNCNIDVTSLPTPGCRGCEEMTVDDLDEFGFEQLMGCTREQFLEHCAWLSESTGEAAPRGLVNFWDAIRGENALRVAMGRRMGERPMVV